LVDICPRCLESLERWVQRHQRHEAQEERGSEGIELGVGFDEKKNRDSSRGKGRGDKNGIRVNRRALLEKNLDREVSLINNGTFWVLAALVVVFAVSLVVVLTTKLASQMPTAKPAAPAAGFRDPGPATPALAPERAVPRLGWGDGTVRQIASLPQTRSVAASS
jgi:hypothetical protein